MKISAKSGCSWLGLALLGLMLRWVARGYALTVIPYALTIVFFAWGWRSSDRLDGPQRRKALGATLVLFWITLLVHPGPYYWANLQLRYIFAGLVALQLPLVLLTAFQKRVRVAWVGAFYALMFAQGLYVLWACPNPPVDVFSINTAASRFFLSGVNPYAQIYPDIYKGAYPYAPLFPYWPGNLWAMLPFEAIFHEIRLTYLLAYAVAAFFVFRLARLRGAEEREAHLWAMLALSAPVVFFVLEQAWLDPLLMASFAAAIWALETRRVWLIALGSALLCSTKQYGLIPAWFVLAQAGRDLPRSFAKLIAIFIALLALVFVPFIAWDAGAFYRSTLTHFLHMGIRKDAFSFVALALNEFGVSPPQLLSLGLTAATALTATWTLWTRRLSAEGASYLTFAVFFLFGKISFVNYHHLLWFIGLLTLLHHQNIDRRETR